MLSFEDWKIDYLKKIKVKSKKTRLEHELLKLIDNSDNTKIQQNALSRLLNEQYKIYKVEMDLQARKSKVSHALSNLNKEKNKSTRKERAHRLIQQGLIIDVTEFPQEPSFIAGALIFTLDKTENNNVLQDEIKKMGAEFLRLKNINKLKI